VQSKTGQEPISPESKKLLTETTLVSLEDYVALADTIRNSIRNLDNITAYMLEQKMELPPEYHHLRRLSECSLLLCLVWLDITSGCRVYLKAEGTYENPYAAKQLIVTINEGFKQIYGYQWYDDRGNLKSRERNQSFWIKDIGRIVAEELPSYKQNYDRITLLLEEYNDDDLRDLKDPRDLFVHYDKTPSLVYDELIRQNMEKTIKKVIPLMQIIAQMITFNKELTESYSTLLEIRKDNTVNFHLQKLESFKKQHQNQPELLKMLTEMQDLVKNFGR
jgi:hypothetical protein